VACREGHFVCDPCHAAPARELIERACLASRSTDPVALSTALMRHPALKLHGPEHHFLVPAALLTALCNARGDQAALPRLLSEARRRSDAVPGGSCGFQGACGAGVGVGIFASVGGPRCCKRTSWLALLTGIRFAREHLGVRLPGRGAACGWSEVNAECLDQACPFHPERHGGTTAPTLESSA
jgi:hypothetical protein